MKIYIAGKITGLVYEDALRAFAGAADELRRCGHEPVNPMAEIERILGGRATKDPNWKACMSYVLPILMRCDAIYLLETWKDSKGARLEKHIAEELGMMIVTAGFQGKRGEIFSTNNEQLTVNSGGQRYCGRCGRKLNENESYLLASECFRCHNSISTVSGVGIQSAARV